MIKTSGYKWWGGYDDEVCVYGPHDTKEGVIAEAVGDRTGEFQAEDGTWKIGVHVCEARNDPLRLADWIEVDRFIERADESLYDSDRISIDHDDGTAFECTHEQEADLYERIKAACDEWQTAHRLGAITGYFCSHHSAALYCFGNNAPLLVSRSSLDLPQERVRILAAKFDSAKWI